MEVLMYSLVILLITIGLAFGSYRVGKHGVSVGKGLIIPIGYLVLRMLLTIGASAQQMLTSLIGAIVIAAAYYGLYALGKSKA